MMIAEPRSLQQQKIMHNYTTITDNRGDLSMQIANVVQPDQRLVSAICLISV